jgi:hypothetical protein
MRKLIASTFVSLDGILQAYQAKDDPTEQTLNAAKKHVATRTLKNLEAAREG